MTREWRDSDSLEALEYFQLGDYPTLPHKIVETAIEQVARERSFHPVRDYLQSLKWDGKPRIDNWLIVYCGALAGSTQIKAYLKAIGAKFLISAVARIYQPGCKVDCVLV